MILSKPGEPEEVPPMLLDHVNICVDDLARMVAFYRDLLGLRVVREITIGGDWIGSVTGLENVQADVVYLQGEGPTGLELICYRHPARPRPAGLELANTPGVRHIAFQTENLDAVAAALQAAGVPLVSRVQEVPTEQVDFAGRRKRIVYCHDPEGNLVELCCYEAGSPQ